MTVDPQMLAALGAPVVRPPFLAYLDVAGDPLRATTWATSLAPVGTGDPDLDGHTFSAVDPKFASVSPVTRATGGSDAVTVSLSGIVGPDSDLLDLLGDQTKWKGRVARLWFMLLDESGERIGAMAPYYTGRMVSFTIKGSSTAQRVEVTVESYLASLKAASNRSYLDQHDFDPNDQSAAITTAIVNGATAAAVIAAMPVSGNSYGAIGGGGIGIGYKLPEFGL